MADRKSRTVPHKLVDDPAEVERLEARNGLLQFDLLDRLIAEATQPDVQFRLRPSIILDLNREATREIELLAGTYRVHDIVIENSAHEPPPPDLVPSLVEDMCDYVNDRWATKTALHLSAYVMWRLNWIHPFEDGNGRTARAAAYFVFCARLGYPLPGTRTIPEQIAQAKQPYYQALEAADEVWKLDRLVDLARMEDLLEELLAAQLVEVVKTARGQV